MGNGVRSLGTERESFANSYRGTALSGDRKRECSLSKEPDLHPTRTIHSLVTPHTVNTV